MVSIMPRGCDGNSARHSTWQDQGMAPRGVEVPARFLSVVRAEEKAVAFTWALAPGRRTNTNTFVAIWPFIYAFDLLRSRRDRPKLREVTAAAGFPLDRKMAMLATTQRLVIWSAAQRGVKKPALLGEVARDWIFSARLPYVGGGWRVVEIRLIDGRAIRFYADRHHADKFAAALDRNEKAE